MFFEKATSSFCTIQYKCYLSDVAGRCMSKHLVSSDTTPHVYGKTVLKLLATLPVGL
jgi:hypothetical protein